LAAALGRGKEDAKNIVPAPPTEEVKDINYDELYPSTFSKTSTYIRFSQTVEECAGCQYNMTSEDDVHLKSYNQKKPLSSQCSEDDFEKIMDIFEVTAEQQAPFAAVDNTVVGFEVMEQALKLEVDHKAQTFARDIYEYWKTRRQCSCNRPLQPSLKFEIHQDSDDTDPYVCFRRRDVRQTRKTRARDVQSTEKLRKLRKELEEGRQLVVMAQQRELAKRELIAVDRAIFEQRARVKEIRQRLGIKVDDEDLINQKPQKRPKPSDLPQLQRTQATQLRLPTRPDGRPIEADLTLLSDVIAQKENLLQMEIDQKIQQHQRWNQNHVDVTREPLSPTKPQGREPSFRSAITHYLLTPPASLSEESSGDQPSPSPENDDSILVRHASFSEDVESYSQPAYRRRYGRLGRLWIDRRGMASPVQEMDAATYDRWKYDQDDDDEPPIYEVDPYDTKALKFRATIPYSSNFLSRRAQQEAAAAAAAANIQPVNVSAGASSNRPSVSSSTPTNQPA